MTLCSTVIPQEFLVPMAPCGPEQPWPMERTFASLTPLTDPEVEVCESGPALESRVLLMWGKYADENICNEAWVLDITTVTWKKVSLSSMKLMAWSLWLLLCIGVGT